MAPIPAPSHGEPENQPEATGIRISGSRLSAEETAALLLVLQQAQSSTDAQGPETLHSSTASRRRRLSTWAGSAVQTWRSSAGLR
ncbi:MAG: hypothetical protein ACTHZ5_02850 [Micrococcaceae bacterium]